MDLGRYERNGTLFTPAELSLIRQKSVCVIGCGGLGGFVINALARFGVGRLVIVDGDVFGLSNLNRQLFATEKTLGQNKALVCRDELAKINSDVSVLAFDQMLTESNAASILKGHDLIMDCLDNPDTRLLLERCALELGITVIHAAVSGFWGQVSTVLPGDNTLQGLYSHWNVEKMEAQRELGNPVFTVQAVSAIQCSEALKYLAHQNEVANKTLVYIDMLSNSIETIDIS